MVRENEKKPCFGGVRMWGESPSENQVEIPGNPVTGQLIRDRLDTCDGFGTRDWSAAPPGHYQHFPRPALSTGVFVYVDNVPR